ncbi:MAG: hypothetical protein JRE23_16300 [Deltaproteobacteria bacterium]|nr:hypothetical protein [Deltaproteobacteria bacterium]
MGKIIEIGDTIRIEDGPPRKKATATAEILDDKVTAKHYQKGRFDAMGKTIVLGEEMTFLDYYGKHVFYVYKHDGERWQPVGVAETEDEAHTIAEGV